MNHECFCLKVLSCTLYVGLYSEQRGVKGFLEGKGELITGSIIDVKKRW